ncbi:MAG: hypothetical protein Q3962_03445 [Corynebacterium sp.]|nr:hypothetical protein [Corynebacterium sp.]
MKRRHFLFLAGVAALSACSGQTKESVEEETATTTTRELPQDLPIIQVNYPLKASPVVGSPILLAHVFEPFLALCEKQEDGSYQIREKANFHDGSRVTSEDIAWSIAGTVKGTGVNIIDDRHFSISDESAVNLDARIIPKHATDTPNRKKAFEEHPIGSGPYSFQDANDEGYTLHLWEGYNGPLTQKALGIRVKADTKGESDVRMELVQDDNGPLVIEARDLAGEQQLHTGAEYVRQQIWCDGNEITKKFIPEDLEGMKYVAFNDASISPNEGVILGRLHAVWHWDHNKLPGISDTKTSALRFYV